MRTELPRARVEVKGATGHLARAAAETRQHARVAGRLLAPLARVVAVGVGSSVLFGLIVAISGPCPRPAQERQGANLRELQESLRQLDAELEALRGQLPLRAVIEISRETPAPDETGAAAPTPR